MRKINARRCYTSCNETAAHLARGGASAAVARQQRAHERAGVSRRHVRRHGQQPHQRRQAAAGRHERR